MSTRDLLAAAGLPRHESERLLQLVTGGRRVDVLDESGLVAPDRARFIALVERRAAGEPLQYLEGFAAFGPIEVAVDGRVLIPRPETEQLWERAIAALPDRPARVLDLCTGSGCLALAVKHARPEDDVVGTDASPEALDVAQSNAERLGLAVEFVEGDLFGALATRWSATFDLIISNPPYVSEREWESLPAEIRDHEPRAALLGGNDGLSFHRRIASGAPGWLAPGGALVLEIGDRQGPDVLEILRVAGWAAELDVDLAGRDRFVVARWQN